jgi:hypothetical protein
MEMMPMIFDGQTPYDEFVALAMFTVTIERGGKDPSQAQALWNLTDMTEKEIYVQAAIAARLSLQTLIVEDGLMIAPFHPTAAMIGAGAGALIEKAGVEVPSSTRVWQAMCKEWARLPAVQPTIN